MATASEARVVFTGTHGWYEIVERDGELALSEETFPAGWEAAAEAAGVNVDDGESWVALVEEVAERHGAIRPGDYACCDGHGCDVAFVRLAPSGFDTSTIDATAASLRCYFADRPELIPEGGFERWVNQGWGGPGQDIEEWAAAWEDAMRDD